MDLYNFHSTMPVNIFLVREHKVQKYSPMAALVMGSCVIHQWNQKNVQINIFDDASSAYGAERP